MKNSKMWLAAAVCALLLAGGASAQEHPLNRLYPVLTAEQSTLLEQMDITPEQYERLSRLRKQLGYQFYRRERSSKWDPIVHERVMEALTPQQRELLFRMQMSPDQTSRLFESIPLPRRPKRTMVMTEPPPAPQASEHDRAGVEAMLGLTRAFLEYAREDRLDNLKPTAAQQKALASTILPEGMVNEAETRAIVDEVFRTVDLSPEQAARMKSFQLTRDQGVRMMELMLDLAPELLRRKGGRDEMLSTLAPGFSQILTPQQMDTLASLDLSDEQMQRMGRTLAERGLPLIQRLKAGAEKSREGVADLGLTDEQAYFLDRMLEMVLSTQER